HQICSWNAPWCRFLCLVPDYSTVLLVQCCPSLYGTGCHRTFYYCWRRNLGLIALDGLCLFGYANTMPHV
ncbi:hypothetical protein J6590_106198, partial [Homalodisca vitripennis]